MMIRFFACFLALLVSSGVFGASHRESVTSSQPLMKVFGLMSEIAGEGPELSFFGWTEVASSVPEDARCASTSLADAVHYITGFVDEMDWAAPEQKSNLQENLPQAMKDFARVLGAGELEWCIWGFHEKWSYTKVVRMKNLTTGYEITLSEGYED